MLSRSAAPHDPHPAGTARPARRTLLLGAVVLPVASCGRLRIGQPTPYTPPPPGIDELYRTDLLTSLDRLRDGLETVQHRDAAAAAKPVAALLEELSAAAELQRRALSTEAELEAAASATGTGGSATDTGTATGPEAPAVASDAGGGAPVDGPASDVPTLLTELVSLRALASDAARQVSGALARPVLAVAVHAGWAAARLHTLTRTGSVAAPPAARSITPTREVPADDPPSVGARQDYEATLTAAQESLWVAGYAYEVLAAQADGEPRTQRRTASDHYQELAASFAQLARQDGCPVATRQAVYPLEQGAAGVDLAALPRDTAVSVLTSMIALTGAAPFERRALPIATALAEAHGSGGVIPALPALLSLTAPEGGTTTGASTGASTGGGAG